MKRVLITGAGSYIGTSFEAYIKETAPEEYAVDTVDMIDGSWREKDFSKYDAIYHVAGIAHQKETKENAESYYRVNRDLAIECAKKAKAEGVGQFIFLSSMSVYGKDVGVITPDTKPSPKSNYGKSKLQAEEGLSLLADEHFRIAVLRPPMVYGKGCRGNFGTVLKLVRKSPVFPRIGNERSMIHVDNLSAFIKLCLDKELEGLYFPQNKDYVKTVDIARTAAKKLGKKRYFSFLLGFGVAILRLFLPIAKKAFGTLIYRDTERFDFCYETVSGKESLEKSIEG